MKKLLLLCLGLLLCAQSYAEEKQTDSIVQAYMIQCRNNLRKPEIVAMCDTLYNMAVEKEDLNIQGTAMIYVADYYFSKNDMDSVKICKDRIERFARINNEPKPFYFAWNLVVSLYTKTARYTLAQYEIEQMLQRAKKDDYKLGVAQAYNSLGNIYNLRGVHTAAIEYYTKASDYILANDLAKYQLTSIYGQLATCLSTTERYNEALEALDRAESYAADPRHKYLIDSQRAAIYAKQGNSNKALELLHGVEKNRPPFLEDIQFYQLRMTVYQSCGIYSEAINASNRLIEEYERLGATKTYYADIFRSRAKIYASMGNMRMAYEDLNIFTDLFNEKISKEGENTLAEFATLMGVEQLNREKVEIEQRAHIDRLRRNRVIIGTLCATLLLAIGFIVVQIRSKRSLHRAKLAVEKADHMKGEFIRQITHEVNTPLNSIVGFAQLAITAPESDPERPGYIAIMNENSDHLQKLIDDILYVSDLESSNEKPALTQTDLADCCRHAMNNVSHLRKDGVEIVFAPQCEKMPAVLPIQFVIKVVTELLRNSITFTTKGTIELAASLDTAGQQATITVTDTGCGIPATESERIFERFVKLNSFSHGTGIGLAVCRMIASAINGQVQVDKSYTSGARFIFTFPSIERS